MIASAVCRRPEGTIAALEALCRRHRGFGLHRAIPEQRAAVSAIATIGGADARRALAAIIADQVIQGPGIAAAVAAARLAGCRLPAPTVLGLLRHAEPAVRADAAACAPGSAEVIEVLAELLYDLHPPVAQAAALALGRHGDPRAKMPLLHLLRIEPSDDVVAAIAPVADADVLVQLGRIARAGGTLGAAARAVLEDCDHERAAPILTALRRDTGT